MGSSALHIGLEEEGELVLVVTAVAPDGVPAQYGVVVIFRLTTTPCLFFHLANKIL